MSAKSGAHVAGQVLSFVFAAIFAFAPKSVVLGLLFGTLGQVIGLILLLILEN